MLVSKVRMMQRMTFSLMYSALITPFQRIGRPRLSSTGFLLTADGLEHQSSCMLRGTHLNKVYILEQGQVLGVMISVTMGAPVAS